MTEPIRCRFAGCRREAVEMTADSYTGAVTWAVCSLHKRWERPYVEEHGRELGVPGQTLLFAIRAAVEWRLGLAGHKLPRQTVQEVSWDVLLALFDKPWIRSMVRSHASDEDLREALSQEVKP